MINSRANRKGHVIDINLSYDSYNPRGIDYDDESVRGFTLNSKLIRETPDV